MNAHSDYDDPGAGHDERIRLGDFYLVDQLQHVRSASRLHQILVTLARDQKGALAVIELRFRNVVVREFGKERAQVAYDWILNSNLTLQS
ncbi:hypothetical protein VN11_11320 [Stenotrophomonas maltophilia]|nr:hypothetical protein VN11_11320 [Stenotrophomonas maltophilia]